MKPLKYILIIIAVLCLVVFLITIPSRNDSKNNLNNITEAVTSESDVINAGGEPETENTDNTDAPETSASTTIPPLEPTPEYTGVIRAPKTDNPDIDNNWAMFLVNQTHKLKQDFNIETTVIYTGDDGRKFEVDSRIANDFKQMMDDAKAAGSPIGVCSAYRTIEYQKQNFENNVKRRQADGMTYEEAYADTAKNVALPGESEHNTGLALDILSGEHWALDEGFANTRAFKWLSEHAHEYGFILRYPKNKTDITGINYEPWHYRYVGVYYATKIKESGLCLEEYIETLNPEMAE